MINLPYNLKRNKIHRVTNTYRQVEIEDEDPPENNFEGKKRIMGCLAIIHSNISFRKTQIKFKK